ncbi:unnamed protein product [Linum trigynum]|uniref:RNase H type-1 domain-containing protein n=1 Tax=Linum trigynum TaxID=586398 RepID=A0AAV2G523_9ROSI
MPSRRRGAWRQNNKSSRIKNVVEYEAVIAGICMSKELAAQKIHVKSDSALVVNQLNGVFEVKEEALEGYVRRVKEMGAWFSEVLFAHIPREENAHADALSKLATAVDFAEDRKVIVTAEAPQEHLIATLSGIGSTSGWMAHIELFLTQGVVPMTLRKPGASYERRPLFHHRGSIV